LRDRQYETEEKKFFNKLLNEKEEKFKTLMNEKEENLRV